MELTTREHKDIKIIDFIGHLDTNTANDADDHLKALMDTGTRKFVLNFENLDYISSAGLRVLLGLAKQLKVLQGQVRLCQLNKDVKDIFDISGFSTIFKVTHSEAEALKDF